MRIVVIGGSGHIGTFLVPRLVRAGHEVVNISRGQRSSYVDDLMGLVACRSNVVQLHGVGLSLIATSTPSLRIESRRNGILWTQTYEWGVAAAAPRQMGPTTGTGTRIEMAVDPEEADIDRGGVVAQVEHWHQAHPALAFVMH